MTGQPVDSRPVRIAHVIQNLNYGGMERVLHSLARHLPPRGFEVHIVVLEYLGQFSQGLEGLATLHQVPPMSRFSLFRPKELAAVLRRIAPDIVHSHTGVWLKAARAARAAGIPFLVHTEHGRPDPVPLADRLIDNRASRLTDTVIAVSEPLAAVLRNQVMHDPSRVLVIPNGLDLSRLRPPDNPGALRRELGIPEGAMVVGSVGRLEPVKHFELALRAFALLETPPATVQPVIVIVGDGSERPKLEALAAELGISARVRFLGWRADAERLYGAFDLFTLSSRSEGTSISLLEAMSMGVCPIVTDVGGNRAVLGPELEELLVPADSASQLKAGWQRLLANGDLRRDLGRRAQSRVGQVFGLEGMLAQHAALYRGLLGQRY